MPPSRVLIVALDRAPRDSLRDEVGKITDLERADVRVVSPASKLSPLDWLANDEDDARDRASAVAKATAEAVGADPAEELAQPPDVDPLQATEDALAEFDAEAIVVVLPAVEHASWLDRASAEDGFERFGRPVTYVASDG